MKRGLSGRFAPRRLRRWVRPGLIGLFVCSVVALLLNVIAQSPSGAPARPVVLATSNWAPYVASSFPDGGPAALLVSEALGRAGYAAEISFTSWAQVDHKVSHGTAAAAFPVVASAERRRLYLVSEPLMTFEYVLFYDRTAGSLPRVEQGSDLGEHRIGTIAGYDYWEEFESNASDIVEYDNSVEAFEALRRGDVELVAEGLVSGLATIDSAAFSGSSTDIKPLPRDSDLTSSYESLHLVAPRTVSGQHLIDQFNAELEQFKGSGDYTRLVADMQTPAASSAVLMSTTRRSALVQLYRKEGAAHAVTPSGTDAMVLSWPQTASTVEEAADELVKVKITSGPQAGQVAHVPYRAIQLVGALS